MKCSPSSSIVFFSLKFFLCLLFSWQIFCHSFIFNLSVVYLKSFLGNSRQLGLAFFPTFYFEIIINLQEVVNKFTGSFCVPFTQCFLMLTSYTHVICYQYQKNDMVQSTELIQVIPFLHVFKFVYVLLCNFIICIALCNHNCHCHCHYIKLCSHHHRASQNCSFTAITLSPLNL